MRHAVEARRSSGGWRLTTWAVSSLAVGRRGQEAPHYDAGQDRRIGERPIIQGEME